MRKLILSLALSAVAATAVAGQFDQQNVSVTKSADGRILMSASEPAEDCVKPVADYVAELLPHASALAGIQIDVGLPSAAASRTDQSGGTRTANDTLAQWHEQGDGTGALTVFTSFCQLPVPQQRAVIAHELGHAVDHVRHPAPSNPIAAQFNDSHRPWAERRSEIAATAWARKIYERAGLNVAEFDGYFTSTHSLNYFGAVAKYQAKLP